MARDRGRVFACAKPMDLRKSFDTLSEVVRSSLGEDPLSGDHFLFVNRRCDRAKILSYDGTGLCIYQKRLEKLRFAAPWRRSDDASVVMTMSELQLFLDGSQLVFMGRLTPDPVRPKTLVNRSLAV